jgi:hypothetical protein
MPNAGYAFKSIENVSTVVIANSNYSRFTVRKIQLLDRQRMVKLPLGAKTIE